MSRAPFVAAVALLGCTPGEHGPPTGAPAPGFDVARAFPDCAPWDGPAITIILAATPATRDSVPFPNVRLSLYGTAATLSGARIAWGADEVTHGAAVHCTGPTACQTATDATVTLQRFDEGLVPGSITLRFGDGTTLRTGFRAALDSATAFCG